MTYADESVAHKTLTKSTCSIEIDCADQSSICPFLYEERSGQYREATIVQYPSETYHIAGLEKKGKIHHRNLEATAQSAMSPLG